MYHGVEEGYKTCLLQLWVGQKLAVQAQHEILVHIVERKDVCVCVCVPAYTRPLAALSLNVSCWSECLNVLTATGLNYLCVEIVC